MYERRGLFGQEHLPPPESLRISSDVTFDILSSSHFTQSSAKKKGNVESFYLSCKLSIRGNRARLNLVVESIVVLLQVVPT